MEDSYFIEPNLYTADLKEYFNSLKQKDDFPKKYLEELILINKLTENEELINETHQLINKHASPTILKAFNLKKKFPNRNKKNSVDCFLVLLSYAKKAPDLDIGKMYELLGFDELFINNQFKEDELPEKIVRFNRATKLTIISNSIKSIPISINELKNLEEIRIDNGHISSLPKELIEIPFLKKLEISLSSFSSFPEVIFSLPHLEFLEIFGESLFNPGTDTTVQIPAEVNQLTNLKELSISCINQENFPEELFKMTNLESFELIKVSSLKSLPSSIKNLRKLKSLKISNCENFEKLPDEIIELNELEEIELYNLKNLQELNMNLFGLPKTKKIILTKLGPFSIKKTNQKESPLKQINITHPLIFDFIFNNSAIFKNLEQIKISEEAISNSLSISHFSNLHTLEIIYKNASIIENIDQLPSLKNLIISYAEGDLPDSITKLNQLEKLIITSKNTIRFSKIPSAKNNHIEIKADEIIFDMKDELYVKELKLNGNIKNIENIFQLKGLEALTIHSSEIKNIPNELGNLSDLKKLNLRGKFTSLPETIGNLSLLEECFISTSYRIPVEKNGFNLIPSEFSQLKSLKKLTIENYEGINFNEFLCKFSNLEVLRLSHCHELIELPIAIKNLTKLSEIEIFICDQFSKLNGCLENLPSLKKIHINCKNLEVDQFEELSKLNQLEELTIHIDWNETLEVPFSITKLKNLKILELGLRKLKELPEFIDQLKNLEELYIDDCYYMKTLPTSLVHLPKLKKLAIPTSINYLQNELKKLNLDTLFLWMSKFAGSNVKQEVYTILIGPNTEMKQRKNRYNFY